MLTNKDINKLTSLLSTKEDTHEIVFRITKLEETVRELMNAINKLVRVIGDLNIEYVAIKSQLDRHEKWIRELAKKSSLNLKN